MTTRFSDREWGQLWNESIDNGSISVHSDGGDRIKQGYVGDLCQVYDRRIQLRNGLYIHIYNYEPLDTLIKSSPVGTCSVFVLSFFVTGNVNTTLHPIAGDVAECAGKNYLCCHSDTRETEEWKTGQKILRVRVLVEPQALFASFGTELVEQLSPELQSLITGNKQQPYYYLGTTTLEMQQAVRQILNCPYQGLMKQMYLESKALELITLRFDRLLEESNRVINKTRLQEDDIDRIHLAKDILTKNMTEPPSLMELARLVGINDCKLKQGFRQVFSTTAFGYLHQHRLEQARQLLATGKFSVTDVCHQVGFADRSYFAVAFRKQFGLNPSAYRRECRSK